MKTWKKKQSHSLSKYHDKCHLRIVHKMQNSNVDQNNETSNSTEVYEDAKFEQGCSNLVTSIDLYGIASTADQLAGNLNIQPDVLNDFFDKLKKLEHEWYEAEGKFKNLQIENDKIVTQLECEKTKCSVLQKKLKFIKDNHKNFERLKQVYLNMRYQESTKSTAEIREEYCQTVDSQAPDVSTIISSISRDSLVSVKKSELTDAQENLKTLKEMVKKREESWMMNMQRERTYKEHINILQHENEMLNQLMKVKDMEIKAMRITEEMNSKLKGEMDIYKRIIGKMDKKLRELEKAGKIGKYTMNFNDKEKRFYEEINKNSITAKSQTQEPSLTSKKSLKNPAKMTCGKAVCQKKDSLGEMQELEFLRRVKKEIERKQANLKEKVQEITDGIDVPGASSEDEEMKCTEPF